MIKSDSDEQKKGRQLFSGKIGVTPSVAAPGDINPSDATGVEWNPAHSSRSLALLQNLNAGEYRNDCWVEDKDIIELLHST